jgi:hypothetical protein
MQPRIYTYKITFEEIPHWYWGVHKEKKFGEVYLGSPETHKWMWEFYTPKIQILEFFPYTDEGWKEAQNVENRCIEPDLNNPLCLNEHYGSVISLEARRKGGNKNVESGHLLRLSQTVGPVTRRKRSINAKEMHRRRTTEEKEEIAKRVTETWKNRPPEEKLEISERRAERMREVHRNYTPEMRELRVQKAVETKSNYPPEKKEEISEKISKAISLAAANRSPEEKARLHDNLSKIMKKKKWWVNPQGETLRSENCPGEGWRPGRKFTKSN